MADREITREIKDAATTLSIVIHDHIVVGNGQWLSFRGEGPLWRRGRLGGYATRRLTTCTANGVAARSTVYALTFRAVMRTLLFDQTWQSSTKAMLLVSSDASAKSPRRAPGTVTSTLADAQQGRAGAEPAFSGTY